MDDCISRSAVSSFRASKHQQHQAISRIGPMSQDAVEGLLSELEPLPHRDRLQRMLELGRAAASDPTAKQIVEALGARGRYGQLLAAHARQQTAAVALTQQLRDAGAGAASASGEPDPELLALGADELRVRLAQMHKAGCWGARLHQLVEALSQKRDMPRLAVALCYGSAAQVEACWRSVLSWALDKDIGPGPGAAPFLTTTSGLATDAWKRQCNLWKSVARQHPLFISGQVGGSGSALNLVLGSLCEQCPAEALRLYRGLSKAERARVVAVQKLLNRYPAEVIELALERDQPEQLDTSGQPDGGVALTAAAGSADLSTSSSLVEWEVVSNAGSGSTLSGALGQGSAAAADGEGQRAVAEPVVAEVYTLLKEEAVYTGPNFRLRQRYVQQLPRELLLRVLLSGQWSVESLMMRVSAEQAAQLAADWKAWFEGQHAALQLLRTQGQGKGGRAGEGVASIAQEVEAQAFALWEASSARSLYSIINRLSPEEEVTVMEMCMALAPQFLRQRLSPAWVTSRLADWPLYGELSKALHEHSRLLLEGTEHVEARLAVLMPLLTAQEQVSLHRLRRSQQSEDEAAALKKREAAAALLGPHAVSAMHVQDTSALLTPLLRRAAASDPVLSTLGGNKAEVDAVASALATALAAGLQLDELLNAVQLLQRPREGAAGERLGLSYNPALTPMTKVTVRGGPTPQDEAAAASVLALRLLPEALSQVFEDWQAWWGQQVLPQLQRLLSHLAPAADADLPPKLSALSGALAAAVLGRLAPHHDPEELLRRMLTATAQAISMDVLHRALQPWLSNPTDGAQPAPWLLLPPAQRVQLLRLCLQGAGGEAGPAGWGVQELTTGIMQALRKVDLGSELCRCSPLSTEEASLILASPQAMEGVLQDGAVLLPRLPAAARAQLASLHSDWMVGCVLKAPQLMLQLPDEAHLLLANHSPATFMSNVQLLTFLTPQAQVQVLQGYAQLRSAKEAALGTLLASTPGHAPSEALSSKLRSELSSADPLAVGGAAAGEQLCAQARDILFNACREVWVAEGWVTQAPLALLPQPYRAAIASSRAQELAALARRPGGVKPVLGPKERAVLTWLSWEDIVSHPVLAGMLFNKDAAVRSEALQFLFQVAQQQPAHIPQLLASVHARRREADPIRQIMLAQLQLLLKARLEVEAAQEEAAAKAEALALAAGEKEGEARPRSTTPALAPKAAAPGPSLPALLPAVSVIIEDALAAKDLSRTSLYHMSSMLAQLLGSPHASAACDMLALCARSWGLAAVPLDQISASIRLRLVAISAAAKKRAAAAAAPLLRMRPPAAAAVLAALPPGRSARWARAKARTATAEAGAEEAYLVQVLAGMSSVMEAMRQRQDGVQDAIKLLRLLWQVCSEGRAADTFNLWLKPQLMDLAHVTVGMLEAASAAAGAESAAGGAAGSGPGAGTGPVAPAGPSQPPTLAVLAAGQELEFLGKLLLSHAPDSFPRIQRHVFAVSPGSNSAVHCVSALNLLAAVPDTRPDLMLTFISQNKSMPTVGARALERLHTQHQEVLRQAVPSLFQGEPSLAVLPVVLDHVLNSRQDLLWPLLQGPVLGGMYAEEPPISPEHVANEFKRACRICFWLAVPRPTPSQLLTWTPAQQAALADMLGKVLRRGMLSLSDSKTIVNLIADLEFIPPTGLLALLQEPGPGAGVGAGVGAGAGTDEAAVQEAGAGAGAAPQDPLVSEAMRDCVLAALARRLGDSNAVWEALAHASASGDVNAALAAVSSLHNFSSPGSGAGGVKLEAAEVLVRLRSIPWTRAAVLKLVVKLLGKLVPLVPEAFTDLMSIASSNSMQGVQMQLVATLLGFLDRPAAKAFVLAAAANHMDLDLAMAAAVVPPPPHEPGVLAAVVEVFVVLLSHPSPVVRQHAMVAWSGASCPVPLALGLPVATAMLAIARQPKVTFEEQGEARRHASTWFMAVG